MAKVEIKTTNPFLRLLIAFSLWLVSFVLKYFCAALSMVFVPCYYLISLKWRSGSNKLADWLYYSALSNDQHGNVNSALIFQKVFTKKGGFEFGDPDDTVSYVLARNKYKGKLNFFGRVLCGLLDAIDYTEGGHMKKSIEMKIESDEEAVYRYQNHKYFE